MRLTNKRYEEIKKEVCNLLTDYDVKCIPIDVFDLARKMKIIIKKSSEILNNDFQKMIQFKKNEYLQSYFAYDEINQRFVVYLDDIDEKMQRQRFGLAHEIMHIILGHTEQNSKNESEANFGATYLLVCTSFILIKSVRKFLMEPELVMGIFDVSYSVAKIAVNYFKNRVLCEREIEEYELEIINRFYTFLEEKIKSIKNLDYCE